MSLTKSPYVIYSRTDTNSYTAAAYFPASESRDDIERLFQALIAKDREANPLPADQSDFILMRGEILDSSYRGSR